MSFLDPPSYSRADTDAGLAAVRRAISVRVEETGAGHGPFTWKIGTNEFGGVTNPLMLLGYNTDLVGLPVREGEPIAFIGIEADYFKDGDRHMEGYLQFDNAARNISIRPFFFQTKRDATTVESFLTFAAIAGNPLNVVYPDSQGGTPMATFGRNYLTLHAPLADHPTTFRLKAAPGQASQILLGSNGSDDVFQIAADTVDHASAAVNLNGQRIVTFFAAPNGAPGAAIAVGAIDNSAAGVFAVGSSHSSVKALVARAGANQSANIFEVQDPAGDVYSGFTRRGHLFTRRSVPPADDDLAPGEGALWIDATTGDLKWKSKTTSGSMRSGTLEVT